MPTGTFPLIVSAPSESDRTHPNKYRQVRCVCKFTDSKVEPMLRKMRPAFGIRVLNTDRVFCQCLCLPCACGVATVAWYASSAFKKIETQNKGGFFREGWPRRPVAFAKKSALAACCGWLAPRGLLFCSVIPALRALLFVDWLVFVCGLFS